MTVDSLTGEDLVCDDDSIDEDEDNELLDPPKCLSDVFEAIVGAVFVDSGMSLDTVWTTFEPILKPLLGMLTIVCSILLSLIPRPLPNAWVCGHVNLLYYYNTLRHLAKMNLIGQFMV